MSRPVKNGGYLSCKIEADIDERLKKYLEESRMTKTAVVELALSMYLDAKEKEAEALKNLK